MTRAKGLRKVIVSDQSQEQMLLVRHSPVYHQNLSQDQVLPIGPSIVCESNPDSVEETPINLCESNQTLI